MTGDDRVDADEVGGERLRVRVVRRQMTMSAPAARSAAAVSFAAATGSVNASPATFFPGVDV